MKRLALLLLASLLLTGCSLTSRQDTSKDETKPADSAVAADIDVKSPASYQAGDFIKADIAANDYKKWFYAADIDTDVRKRITGISYPEDCTFPLDELCYIRVLYNGFDGQTHVGELIVNRKIKRDILEIFEALYEAKYPIESMVLIDNYDGDDETSMSRNNTSAFNYRKIAGSSKMSMHSQGLAIDINPLYNPCVKEKSGTTICQPANARAYIDRNTDFPNKITQQDLCYKLFTKHGFTWGGDWNSVKDYQHFEYAD